jgi:serine O-acetyltransferase
MLVHTSFGIMIADGVVIGDDCRIYNGVCLVNKANFRREGQPRIGNNVTLGVGCKVLGGVTIGDNVVVGANAVVLRDVPSGQMAIGVPAHNKPLPPEWAELQAAELADQAARLD